MKCRSCTSPLGQVFLDLGAAPPSNAYLSLEALSAPEPHYPLKLYTCTSCFLVQVDEVQSHSSLFAPDYAYFSSYSSSWLAHAKRYVDTAVSRLALGTQAFVVEVASNDGYLLQYVNERGIRCLGVEPTHGTAEAARSRGIDTVECFLGRHTAADITEQYGRADLVVGNNVLAHVPDLHDFVGGLATLLSSNGVLTLEFPHLLELVRNRQFDTVYHEHFSYFSLHSARHALAAHGLRIWDVERLPTHGGSLRLWVSMDGADRATEPSVSRLLEEELSAGMLGCAFYDGFQAQAEAVKNDLLRFLLEQRQQGLRVVAYGAAAKGNTLLNFAGVRPDLLAYVVDASPHKQGRWMPGSRIPIVDQDRLEADRPDVVLILPWNLRDEIGTQLQFVRQWGGRLAVAVPAMELFRP